MVDAQRPDESPGDSYGSPAPELAGKLIRRQCGGQLTAFPATFSANSGFFFCSSFVDIKMFSVETGQLFRTLSGHTKQVTSAVINPKNPLQLISSSLDGTIKIWDFNDAVLLKTHDVKAPIVKMLVSDTNAFIMARGTDANKKHAKMYTYSLTGSGELKLLSGGWKCHDFAVSPKGDIVAGIYEAKLIVYQVKNSKIEHQREFEHAHPLTKLCFPPTGEFIATGDANGIITQWFCLEGQLTAPNPVTLHKHWHAHEVLSLTFNQEGTYMLSGGEEAVLVIWQVKSGNKQFLPRLGTPIIGITVSPDQSMYALCHRDGSVRIVSASTLKTLQVTNSLKYGENNILAKTLGKNLLIEPRNGYAVLTGGLPGTIQFYNLKTDQRISEVEIAHQNVVSRIDDEKQIFTHVEFVAFNSDGEWMATVDRREATPKSPEELTLKFWKFDHSTQRYELNTRVESPHKKAVSALLFQPGKKDVAVSLSFDGRFKIWSRVEIADQKGAEGKISSWSCRATGFYRDYAPHDAVFSEDGSILAVSYGQVITLWNPVDNALKMTLCNSTPVLPIRQLEFIPNTHFLVTYTQEYLYVWNLLTCSVWWSCRLKIQCMAVDRKHSKFAVCDTSIAKQSRLLFFSPESPVPFYVYNDLRAGCQSMSFVEDDTNDELTGILILNAKTTLEYLSPKEPTKAVEQQQPLSANEVTSNVFTEIFSKDTQTASSKELLQVEKKLNTTRDLETLNAAAHVLPPVSRLYEPFMEHILAPAPGRNKEIPEDDSSDSESLSGELPDNIEDMEVETPTRKPVISEAAWESSKDINFKMDFMVEFFKRGSITESAQEQPKEKASTNGSVGEAPKSEKKEKKEKKRKSKEEEGEEDGVDAKTPASNGAAVTPGKKHSKSEETLSDLGSKSSKKSRTSEPNGVAPKTPKQEDNLGEGTQRKEPKTPKSSKTPKHKSSKENVE